MKPQQSSIAPTSDPLGVFDRPLILHIARVQCPSRLEQKHVNLLFCDWSVFDPPGHNQELAFLQPDLAVAVLHPESTADHQEEFILVVMPVPGKFAREFYQMDVLPVQLTHDLAAPVVVEEGELTRISLISPPATGSPQVTG